MPTTQLLLPPISVVIPVRDQRERLRQCLAALQRQSYPKELIEIIIVDNKSTDNSTRGLETVATVIYAPDYANPYYARNVGIERATTEIIVLLDAKVLPAPDALRMGIARLQQTQAAVVAGNIVCTLSKKSWAACLYLLRFYPNRLAVAEKIGVPTGFLMIQRAVFERVGKFYTGALGGGDIEWTQRVIDSGENIAYTAPAVGYYQVPGWRGTLAAIKREGQSYRKISYLRHGGRLPWRWHLNLWRYLLPARPFKLKKRLLLDYAHEEIIHQRFWRLWLLHWGSKLLTLRYILLP